MYIHIPAVDVYSVRKSLYTRCTICLYIYIYIYTCFDERWVGRKKEASRIKRITRQSNKAHPWQSLFLRKISCLGWDSNPRHSTLFTERSTTELPSKAAQLAVPNLTSHSTSDEQAYYQLSMMEKAGVMKPPMTPNTKPSIYMTYTSLSASHTHIWRPCIACIHNYIASIGVPAGTHCEDSLREPATACRAEAAHRDHQRPSAAEETAEQSVPHSIERAPAQL